MEPIVPRFPRPSTPVGAMQPEEDDQSEVKVECKRVPMIPFKPVENVNTETSMIARLLQDYGNKNQSALVAPSSTQTTTTQTTTNDNNKRSITTPNTVVCNTMQNNMNLSLDYPTVDFSALFNDNSLNIDFASLGIQPRTAEQVCT